MISASKVAKYIIKAFHNAEDFITHLKLQKLLYYVQGWHLGLYQKELFPEDFQAWVHGPVITAIYDQYKQYKWHPIAEDIECVSLDKNTEEHINEVLNCYGGDTGWELERRTHLEEPWLLARGDLPMDVESENIITKESMRQFFSKLAN